jgi:hypothetical protein
VAVRKGSIKDSSIKDSSIKESSIKGSSARGGWLPVNRAGDQRLPARILPPRQWKRREIKRYPMTGLIANSVVR